MTIRARTARRAMPAEARPDDTSLSREAVPETTAPGPAVPEPAATELERAVRAAVSDPGLAREYLALLRGTPHALYRDGGPAHLTASAVVVDAPGEHVALVWHLKGRFWVQPGGHLEASDTSLEAAVRREIAEETGLGADTGSGARADLRLVGPGPALLEAHDLASTFGSCGGHWDVVLVLRAEAAAEELPMRAEKPGAPTPVWVPWPRAENPEDPADAADTAGVFSRHVPLPTEAASDMPEILERLAPYLDEFAVDR
jgi:8-oxo-dGTP pyrophosphatase MutT (NUDIX family)